MIHVVTPDGALTSYSRDNRAFAVVDATGVHGVDHERRVAHVIAAAGEDTEIFPLVNNYDPISGQWLPSIGDVLLSPDSRAHFLQQTGQFLAANPSYRGLSLDLEDIPPEAQPGYKALLAALYQDFHSRNLKLYVNTPVEDDSYDLKDIADHSDGILLMNYDQHQEGSFPGPIAAQDWFLDNLKDALKMVPKQKIICALGSYGYDWKSLPPTGAKPSKHFIPKELAAEEKSTQEAWQEADDAEAQIELDPDSLNGHFAFDDDDAHVRHQVWFLDAVTVLNQMRAARALGIETFALWRLGSEDNSLWKIWDNQSTRIRWLIWHR